MKPWCSVKHAAKQFVYIPKQTSNSPLGRVGFEVHVLLLAFIAYDAEDAIVETTRTFADGIISGTVYCFVFVVGLENR